MCIVLTGSVKPRKLLKIHLQIALPPCRTVMMGMVEHIWSVGNVAGIKVAPAQLSPPSSVSSRACIVAAADEQDGCAAATTAMCATNVYRFFSRFYLHDMFSSPCNYVR